MISGRIDELEHQIELTRRALDRTLSDLQRRLSPRYQLLGAWDSMVMPETAPASEVSGTGAAAPVG